jgi:hypothetical protein
MRRFFERSFRPFFLLTGAGTALIGAYALAPEWALTHLGRLDYLEEYTIVVQHWGIMVGLMGVFMIGAALKPAWRIPMCLYSALEKAFMVYLVLSHADQSYAVGFWVPAVVDTTVVIYTILYFAVCGFGAPAHERVEQPR